MKKKIMKAALLTGAALVLVVATVLGTIAYLTASSAVANVFTVGNIKISMYETKVDTNGEIVTPVTKVDTNSYHLVPGETYVKDPTIYINDTFIHDNGSSDKMYLFVKSHNQIRNIEAGNQENAPVGTPLSMRQQMEANGWVQLARSENGVEILWVYGTRNINTGEVTPIAVDKNIKQKNLSGQEISGLNAGEFRLCESFTIDEYADVSVAASAKVLFSAFAIQTQGFENDAVKAWYAIEESYPEEGGIVNPKDPYDRNKDAFWWYTATQQ